MGGIKYLTHQEYDEMQTEIKQLRALISEIQKSETRHVDETRRLRATLQQIADDDWPVDPRAIRLAKAALNPK